MLCHVEQRQEESACGAGSEAAGGPSTVPTLRTPVCPDANADRQERHTPGSTRVALLLFVRHPRLGRRYSGAVPRAAGLRIGRLG